MDCHELLSGVHSGLSRVGDILYKRLSMLNVSLKFHSYYYVFFFLNTYNIHV